MREKRRDKVKAMSMMEGGKQCIGRNKFCYISVSQTFGDLTLKIHL